MDRRFDLAAAAAFVALGLFVIYQATTIRSGMVRDPLGPRAAFYLTGGVMAVGGLILIVRSLRAWTRAPDHLMTNEGVEDEPGHASSAARAFLLIGACLLYGLTFDLLGYLIATPLFIAGALAILGQRQWLPVATIAVLFTVINYVVFAQALGVRVPVGPLTGTFRALGLINL